MSLRIPGSPAAASASLRQSKKKTAAWQIVRQSESSFFLFFSRRIGRRTEHVVLVFPGAKEKKTEQNGYGDKEPGRSSVQPSENNTTAGPVDPVNDMINRFVQIQNMRHIHKRYADRGKEKKPVSGKPMIMKTPYRSRPKQQNRYNQQYKHPKTRTAGGAACKDYRRDKKKNNAPEPHPQTLRPSPESKRVETRRHINLRIRNVRFQFFEIHFCLLCIGNPD